MARLGFYFDSHLCVGCRTCQVSCKDRNRLDVDILFRRVRSFEVGTYPNARGYHYSGACNHCQDAKCVKGCPTKALHFDADGTVQHDIDVCIGCQYCTWNCPYGAPQYVADIGKTRKCDSCKPLRDLGKNPVCVDACMMRALDFGDLDILEDKHGHNLVSEIACLETAVTCNPSLLINAKPLTLDANFVEVTQ